MLKLKLKLKYNEELMSDYEDYFTAIKKAGLVSVKLTTNELRITRDRKDARYIKSLDGIKMAFPLEPVGALLLFGNLGCVYTGDFTGEFYCKKVVHDPTVNVDNMQGVLIDVDFSKPLNAMSNELLREDMALIAEDPDFVFNIGQFDDFMEIFTYYKKLSAELNNNFSYKILDVSSEYCFISIDEKKFDSEYKEEIYDANGILIGYRFENYIYEQLDDELRDKVHFLCDVEIAASKNDIRRIKTIGADNVYVSDYENITEQNIKQINQFILVNVSEKKDSLVISGELKNYKETYQFLNLYDMGQKIKVESIDNSLKLIKQGASGAASELLTYLIGDKEMPNAHKVRVTKKIENYLLGLNESQKSAFLKCIDGSPVTLIKGPPGTGKTHVINAVVQYITKELGEKVIVSSQTHIAIDNVLDKLMSNYDVIIPNRITNRKNKYSGSEIDSTLYRTWGVKFEEHNKRFADDKIAKRILKDMKNFKGKKEFIYSQKTLASDFSVIGATTTTSAIAGKKGLELLDGYDWLIIDEVSKCPITEVLRYLPYVNKIIMVGDDYQLAPLLEFNKEDVLELPSYDEDMFEKMQRVYEQSVFADTLKKAEKSKRLVVLNENYRSLEDVLSCYNVFYDNQLISRRNPESKKVSFNNSVFENEKNVYFIEVYNGKEVIEGTSRYNIEELEATVDILKRLIKETIDSKNISVAAIFPYAAQISKFHRNNVSLINESRKVFKSFEIDTVDAFQGKEADIVLLNTVVADSSKRNFLNDFRRINVSMSRAKDKLFIFGNSKVLARIDMKKTDSTPRKFFKDIIENIKINGQYIEYDGGIKNEHTSECTIKFAKGIK